MHFCDIIQDVRMHIDFLRVCLLCTIFIGGCDLQPKISSIPDSIGMFIENRYPALLADPEAQPEIYNSAVTDYGVYASPELYGSSNTDDYVLYASVDDYVLVPDEGKEETEEQQPEVLDDYIVVPMYGGIFEDEKPQPEPVKTEDKNASEIIVVKGDTVYSLARKNNMTVAEFASINDLHEPYTLSIGQKLKTRAAEQKTAEPVKKIPNVISEEKAQEIKARETVKPDSVKRVDVQEIVVEKGDTLYSLSRKYEIPVNDLAVMNKLSAPFTLSIGQKIKVPKLASVPTRSVAQVKAETKKITPAKTKTEKVATKSVKTTQKPEKPAYTSNQTKQQSKISSDPKKQLPKISARSSSKFSWPVRGKILSQYGAKNNGLFNDGINISAARGTAVKAAENGVVAYAGNEVKGMGNLVIIQHSDGWMTVYAHLDSMTVRRGNKVNVGQQIGKIGQTGKVDVPQLHFEIRKGTKAYNPIQYLKK